MSYRSGLVLASGYLISQKRLYFHKGSYTPTIGWLHTARQSIWLYSDHERTDPEQPILPSAATTDKNAYKTFIQLNDAG